MHDVHDLLLGTLLPDVAGAMCTTEATEHTDGWKGLLSVNSVHSVVRADSPRRDLAPLTGTPDD